MKKLIVLLVLMPFFGYGQKFKSTSDIPDRNSNVILVKSNMSDDDLFKVAGRGLIKEGYKIDRSDNTFLSVSTVPEQREDYGFQFNLNLSVVDKQVIIRGVAKNAGYNFPPYYGKGKGAMVPVVAFRFMDDFAKSIQSQLEGSSIIYAVE